MNADEQAIRHLLATWMSATKAGDIETVLSLMTTDVVFLVTGQPPMIGKDRFAAAAAAQAAHGMPAFEGTSEVQEIVIAGDWAFMWTHLTVVVTPGDGITRTRAGHTLTVFRKDAGRWLLARDANMLAPVTNA